MTWNGKLKRDSVGCNSFFNKNKRYQILARRQHFSRPEYKTTRYENQFSFFSNIKKDVVQFITDDDVLSFWRPKYFKDLIEKIKFENT